MMDYYQKPDAYSSYNVISTQNTPHILSKKFSFHEKLNIHADADDDIIKIYNKDLLTRISHGDRQAFWIIWLYYHKDLFILFHRLHKGNHQDIHDSLGNLCIQLIDTMPTHAHTISNCRTWLRRVALNHFIDIYRTRKRHALPVGSLIEIANITDQRTTVTAGDPEQASANRILLRKVLNILQRIGDPRIRQAVHMRFIEEQSYHDIATVMGVTEGLARKWIQQARNHLRNNLPDLEAQTKAQRVRPR